MDEFSKELSKQFEGTGKDEAWIEKLLSATEYEEFEKILGEKGIKAPPELKERFEASYADKTGKLEDDELEKVSGGWGNAFTCPGAADKNCFVSMCPHLVLKSRTIVGCNLGYWNDCSLSDLLY